MIDNHERRPVSARHDRGVRTFRQLLSYWLVRSGLGLQPLALIGCWGCGQERILDKSMLSRIRTGTKDKGPSMKELDALAAANIAIWRWQQQGPEQARERLGPQSSWGVKQEWLDSACWLPHPDHPEEPLAFADLAEVLAGYLELPYLGSVTDDPSKMRTASAALTGLLGQILLSRRWAPAEGIAKLLAAYPATDRARVQRLRRLVMGDHELSAGELEDELHALAEMVRSVRELERYTPTDLLEELLSASPEDRG